MCRGKALGGRRCPCSQGERRRAYQRNLYHSKKQQKAWAKNTHPKHSKNKKPTITHKIVDPDGNDIPTTTTGTSAPGGTDGGMVDQSLSGVSPEALLSALNDDDGSEGRMLMLKTPEFMDIQTVGSLSRLEREELREFYAGQVAELREEAQDLYAALDAAGLSTDTEGPFIGSSLIGGKEAAAYEAKLQELGAATDALTTVNLVDMMRDRHWRFDFDDIQDMACYVKNYDTTIEARNAVKLMKEDALFSYAFDTMTDPEKSRAFEDLLAKREHGGTINEEDILGFASLLYNNESEDDRVTLGEFVIKSMSMDSMRNPEWHQYHDMEKVSHLAWEGMSDNDAENMFDMFVAQRENAEKRLREAYAADYAYEQPRYYHLAYWNSLDIEGDDFNHGINAAQFNDTATPMTLHAANNASRLFPQALLDYATQRAPGLAVTVNKGSRPGLSAQEKTTKTNKKVTFSANRKDGGAEITYGPVSRFINDDGEVDNKAFRQALDDAASDDERQKLKDHYDKLFPKASDQEAMSGILEAISIQNGKKKGAQSKVGKTAPKIKAHPFTGYDGEQRVGLVSARSLKVTDTTYTPVINLSENEDSHRPSGHLTHEFAHYVEKNPQVYMACKQFLHRRTEGLDPVSYLFDDPENGTTAISAISDGFFNTYVGRDYPNSASTEVFSMGMQHIFSEPRTTVSETPDLFDSLNNGNYFGITKNISVGANESNGTIGIREVEPIERYDAEHRNLIMGILASAHNPSARGDGE